LFFAMLLVYGGNSRASVMALAGIFSNTLMIGVPWWVWPTDRRGRSCCSP